MPLKIDMMQSDTDCEQCDTLTCHIVLIHYSKLTEIECM